MTAIHSQREVMRSGPKSVTIGPRKTIESDDDVKKHLCELHGHMSATRIVQLEDWRLEIELEAMFCCLHTIEWSVYRCMYCRVVSSTT